MRMACAVALAGAALAAGCGDDDDDVNNNAARYEGEEAEVAGLVDDFAQAAREGDGAQICEQIFAKPLAQNVERESGQTCETEVETNLEEGEYELEVDSLQVDGDAATAAVTDQADRKNVLHIQRIDADWRIVRVTEGT